MSGFFKSHRVSSPHALLFGAALLLTACPKDKDDTGDTSTPQGWEYIAVTWGTSYFLLDPATGAVLHEVSPVEDGMTDLLTPNISGDGQTLYFTAIPPDGTCQELYSCDLLTGANLTRHTTFNYVGLEEPDASPVAHEVVFQGVEDGGITSIYLLDSDNAVQQLTFAEDPLDISASAYTTVSWGDAYSAWSPDGSQVAFVRHGYADDGEFDIIVGLDPDTSATWEMWSRERDGGLRDLCWTSDGQWIVFSTKGENSTDKSIEALNVADGTVVDLTTSFAGYTVQDHSCSASSPAIVFSDIEVSPNLYVATLSTDGGTLAVTGIEQLTSDGQCRQPDWAGNDAGGSPPDSPDPGTEDTGEPGGADEVIAATWSDGYYLVDPVSGAELYRVEPLETGMSELREPAISDNDGRIYFTSIPAGESHLELYGADLTTGANLSRYTTFQYAGLGDPDASPTGGAVLFEAAESGSIVSIYKLASDGTVTALTHANDEMTLSVSEDVTVSWDDAYPAWSPDGTQAAFYRYAYSNHGSYDVIVGLDPDTGDTWEIYAKDRDGGLRDLCWTADGQYIIASTKSSDDTTKSIFAVDVSSGAATDLTAELTGLAVQDHACSTSELAFTFTDIEVSPSLYLATLEESGGTLGVASVTRIGDQAHYRTPDWGLLN